ncbi:hypothetical protein G647_02773 [Cladophialophora carrionii CBS 160.54]|uniref:Uncharacterized protein n=1 Tax=Cladophialophora carrionii CBS 160.54 TaxID=1279043 RepID=V9DH46_9EURO|nr:uncharacterized protein G647_02773 [Cladophialophora carrionii CBS 160.54]ETI25996.1 hypothetical protein G647_02773 [Cladophialophora carrionii CBS 160.54]
MLSARSDIEVTVDDMTTAISTFQTLIQEALIPTANSSTTPAESDTTAITKRASSSSSSSTAELEEINAIFADIQRLADGSVPLPPPVSSELASRSLARRNSVTDTIRTLVDCLGRLLSGTERRKRRAVSEGSDDDDLAAALATIHGWADGTIPLPNDVGSATGTFTADDGLEFATLLKDVIVVWRAQFEAGLTGPAEGTSTAAALADRAPHGQNFGLDSQFYDIVLDKRGRLSLKIALKALAAAIDAFADTL